MKNTFCYVAVRTGLEPVTPCVTGMYSNQLSYCRKPYVVWAGTDSNCRSREATDLQSARFNHLPTYPSTGLCQEVTPAGFKPATF